MNYYSNVSSDGKEYYYSPKEANNQNSFNSNKISPLNFNYSPSTIFNNPKSNSQNKDLSNNEEDNPKTLQEKMESLVNNHNHSFNLRKNSLPSNVSNQPENINEDNEDDDNYVLTLSIDSGEENDLLGDKNLQFNLNEQENKDNLRKNSFNNLPNKIENENKNYKLF